MRTMTDYKEEQEMEVEALESIYMEEFKKLTDEPLSYQIHVVPNQDGQNNHVSLILKCLIPPTYPDVEPRVDILLKFFMVEFNMVNGLSDRQQKELKQIVAQQVEENIGIPMMYTISEAIRDYLVENNKEGNDGSEYHEMMRRMEQKKKTQEKDEARLIQKAEGDEESSRTFVGTAVTVKSFNEWKLKFDAEMRIKSNFSIKDEGTVKLTGKQLWTKGLVIEGDDEDDDDEDVEDVEELEDEHGV